MGRRTKVADENTLRWDIGGRPMQRNRHMATKPACSVDDHDRRCPGARGNSKEPPGSRLCSVETRWTPHLFGLFHDAERNRGRGRFLFTCAIGIRTAVVARFAQWATRSIGPEMDLAAGLFGKWNVCGGMAATPIKVQGLIRTEVVVVRGGLAILELLVRAGRANQHLVVGKVDL